MTQEIGQEIDQLRASLAAHQQKLNQLLLKIVELEATESERKATSFVNESPSPPNGDSSQL
jgi:phage shock protein A